MAADETSRGTGEAWPREVGGKDSLLVSPGGERWGTGALLRGHQWELEVRGNHGEPSRVGAADHSPWVEGAGPQQFRHTWEGEGYDSSNPEQKFRPLGNQGPLNEAGGIHGPSPQENSYMQTHTLFGGPFQETPRPSGIHKFPRGPALICFGWETPLEGPGTTNLLPKITVPEPVRRGKMSMGNRSGSKPGPWGRGREAQWL